MTSMSGPEIMGAHEWRAAGSMLSTEHGEVFVLDRAAAEPGDAPPLLVVHGFPSSSLDFRHVLDALARHRRVVLFDQLGFGWSDKPDRRYGIRLHADTAERVLAHLGIDAIDLLTHDMGDTVGGELLARDLDGDLGVEIRRRVLTNGSIYLDLAHLTTGQQLLCDLPDAPIDLIDADALAAGVAATFSPEHPASADEIEQVRIAAAHQHGERLLPRTIRYLEDRRAEERRFTGAIETHPSPLGVVWGTEDPVAVLAMTDELLRARPGTPLTLLDGVGHYPMVESPAAFADAVLAQLGPT